MTSISFFFLLLITYSYSVPVEKVHVSSTVPYEFTTDTTMVDHETVSHMPVMNDEQSTGTLNIHKKRINPVDIPPKQIIEENNIDDESLRVQKVDRRCDPTVQTRSVDDDDVELSTQEIVRRCDPTVQTRSVDDDVELSTQEIVRRREPPVQGRSIDEQDSDDITTTDVSRPSRTFEESSLPSTTIISDVSRPSRTFEESSFPSTTIISTVDHPSSHEEHDKRSFKDGLSVRAFESSTEFNRRAIRPIITETPNESLEQIQLLTRNLSENMIETTTDINPTSEPVSSVDSFGKMTGLLHDPSIEISTTTRSSSKIQPS